MTVVELAERPNVSRPCVGRLLFAGTLRAIESTDGSWWPTAQRPKFTASSAAQSALSDAGVKGSSASAAEWLYRKKTACMRIHTLRVKPCPIRHSQYCTK